MSAILTASEAAELLGMHVSTVKLWLLSDVAEHLRISETQAARIVCMQGFPPPVVLPTVGRGERKMKRWIPAKVAKWAESQEMAA